MTSEEIDKLADIENRTRKGRSIEKAKNYNDDIAFLVKMLSKYKSPEDYSPQLIGLGRDVLAAISNNGLSNFFNPRAKVK